MYRHSHIKITYAGTGNFIINIGFKYMREKFATMSECKSDNTEEIDHFQPQKWMRKRVRRMKRLLRG